MLEDKQEIKAVSILENLRYEEETTLPRLKVLLSSNLGFTPNNLKQGQAPLLGILRLKYKLLLTPRVILATKALIPCINFLIKRQ
jgi:hypothetical protein